MKAVPTTAAITALNMRIQKLEKSATVRKETSVQGDGTGSRQGLQGAELEELNRAMGVRKPVTEEFEYLPTGELVCHNIGPTRARELELARQGVRRGTR